MGNRPRDVDPAQLPPADASAHRLARPATAARAQDWSRRHAETEHPITAPETTSTEPTVADPGAIDELDPIAIADSDVPAPDELADERAAKAAAAHGPAFADLGVRAETVSALAKVGIHHAFAIQELTLPIALAGSDLIGQARTGTGKTLGFGVPLLQRVVSKDEGCDGAPQALVVVPTRELCVQVTGDLRDAGADRGIRVLAVYGGRAYEPQIEALRKGVEVVVGTPGRLLDLAQQGHVHLDQAKVLVLDEADEMLDLGFLPDVERIVELLPAERQTMLFSATMPGAIVGLARRFMRQPVHIRAELPDENRVVPNTRQFVYRAHAMDKAEVLARILQAEGRGLTMVFCRTKRTAQKVSDDLEARGFASAAVHGDLGQGAREQALRAFRSGKVDVLVATDVAARGIDVQDVTHVVNYQCPEDEKVYLHRIGRTGRAGADGVAVTFVDWDELARWGMINRALDLKFAEVPETYSTSEFLYSDLGIPAGVKGTLPRGQRTRAGLDAEGVEDLGETGGRRKAGDRVTRQTRPAPGSNSRGGGSGGGRGDSAGRGDSGATSGSEPGDKPAGRARNRNRTRGGGAALAAVAGGPTEGATGHTDGGDPTGSGTVGGTGSAGVTAGPGTDGVTADGDRPKRRRHRGGRGRSGAGRSNADGGGEGGVEAGGDSGTSGVSAGPAAGSGDVAANA